MKVAQLLKEWQEKASEQRMIEAFSVRLPLHDAARIKALAEMYPGRSESDIVAELLGAALDELEEAFPYVQGTKVIAHDDYDDPIYEDAGSTPRFSALTKKYLSQLETEVADPK